MKELDSCLTNDRNSAKCFEVYSSFYKPNFNDMPILSLDMLDLAMPHLVNTVQIRKQSVLQWCSEEKLF